MNVERKFLLVCETIGRNPEEVTLEEFLSYHPQDLIDNTRGFGCITWDDVIWWSEGHHGSHYIFDSEGMGKYLY